MSLRAFVCAGTVLGLAGILFGQPQPSSTTLIFQQGGTNARTTSCTIESSGTVTEADTLTLGNSRGLVAFPDVIGTGPGQVPPGATITSAMLGFRVMSVPGSAPTRTLSLHPLYDLVGLGPWTEPAGAVTAGTGVGVSWNFRDDRLGVQSPWLSPGGDFVAPGPPISSVVTMDQTPGAWYLLNVTEAVRFHANGFSNLGWVMDVDQPGDDVVIAADDHPTPAFRPRLVVTWSGLGSPFNRIPDAPDRTLQTTEGASIFVPLDQTDDDGQSVTYVVRDRPQNGVLHGDILWTYKPSPGFIGTDTWTYFAHDGFSSSRLGTVTVTVNADPAGSTTIYPVSPGSGTTRSATIDVTIVSNGQVAGRGPELALEQGRSAAFIDFPQLVDPLAGVIPAGATIVQAQLALTNASASASGTGVISATRIVDPAEAGRWTQPMQVGPAPDSGVSWLYRDARPGSLTPWLVPGGDRAEGASSPSPASTAPGTVRTFDVTAAVQAWAMGSPNQGWILTSDSTIQTRLASESHPNTAWRPRITVAWRPAGAGGSNLPPVASAGSDQTVVANQLTSLDGSNSYDPEGQALTHYWHQVSGPPLPVSNPLQPSISFVAPTYTQKTVHVFTLAVIDGSTVDFDTVEITVLAPVGAANGPPVADAGPDMDVDEGGYFTLDGSGSYDPEGATLSMNWTQVAGPTATLMGTTPTWSLFRAPYTTPAQSPEALWFRLAVTDGTTTTHDTIRVSVLNLPNTPPYANAGPPQTIETETWTGLDGRASSDPNSPITYAWVQTQGPAVTLYRDDTEVPYLKAPLITAPTDLVFQLTVSDGEFTDTDTTTVSVIPAPIEFSGDPQSLQPYTSPLTMREAQHLMRRAGYGASPTDLATIVTQGLNATIGALRNPVQTPNVDIIAQAEVPTPVPGDIYPQANLVQVARWWLVHKLNTPWTNQLKEKMAYYFHDAYAAGGVVAGAQERHWRMQHLDLFRNNPFPNYRQFLIDLTQDDLMLDWLDNHTNEVGSPNENYAREFWELFTMGEVNPFTGMLNYTETDIQEASRAFTGWERYDPTSNPSNSYYSRFSPSRHDAGPKAVLGYTGNWKDEDIVDITLTFPQAAEYVTARLFRFFVHDHPKQQTVEALAQILTNNGWELGPVIDTILRSQAMFSADAHKDRIKTPVEYLVGFIRQTGLTMEVGDVAGRLEDLGQVLGSPPNVKGWPEGSFWLGEAAIVYRSKAINSVIEARAQQVGVSLAPLLPASGLRSGPKTVAHLLDVLGIALQHDDQFHSLVEYMDTIVVGGGSQSIQTFFSGSNPSHVSRKLRGVLFILAFANPDYHLN